MKERIGNPEIIVCLDSGILNYDQFFITSSLRGVLTFDVSVKTLKTGVHSGAGGGVLPSAYRIMQQLISRIEDVNTGELKLPELFTEIKPYIYEKEAKIAKVIGPFIRHMFPFEEGVDPITLDSVQLLINNGWKPCLTVIGNEGLPFYATSGNVIHPYYATRISIRLPPNVDKDAANDAVIRELTRDPPYNVVVDVVSASPSAGWAAKELEPWLENAIQRASLEFHKRPAINMSEGGSIPFMGILGELFPIAQFVITGILHPESNAHGIDENFSIAYLKKTLACLAYIVGTHGLKG